MDKSNRARIKIPCESKTTTTVERRHDFNFRNVLSTISYIALIILIIIPHAHCWYHEASSSSQQQDLTATNDENDRQNINSEQDESVLSIWSRDRRQTADGAAGSSSSSSGGSSGGGSSNAQTGNAASSDQANSNNGNNPSNNPGDNLSSDEDPNNAVNGFRCDFGASEQPDMCQFRVIKSSQLSLPTASGTTKASSAPAWAPGSGRLALYQGGPVIDATRNDSSGGYVYYETSTSFTMLGNSSSNREDINMYNFIYANRETDNKSPSVSSSTTDESGASYQPVASPTLSVVGNQHHNRHEQHQQRLMIPVTSSLVSPNLTAPGPAGMCLSFQYAIKGLSADDLMVHVNDHNGERSRLIWSASESASDKNWTMGEVLYSVPGVHSVSFSAWHAPKDQQQRKFRGYIALDDIEAQRHGEAANAGACRGHCNFDGDLCGWTNAENGAEDDFDWTFGRGSDNLFTGPARDYVSSANNELTGSYLYTDSAFPRRPGDRAILVSPVFQSPTGANEPMCMRLAVHMFGSGIGTLAIKIRHQGGELTPEGKPIDLTVWEMSGDSGNAWHQAQTSLSSSRLPFQVLIEGIVGDNQLGDMAIDEISITTGACPTSPPVASRNYGDCTFEQSMCYWRNSGAEMRLDELDWVRSANLHSIHGPNFDHTLKQRLGSYLRLENTLREPKAGSRAFLLSPALVSQKSLLSSSQSGASTGTSTSDQPPPVQCLTFFYYMFTKSVSAQGPNLGTLRVYLATSKELTPIWRLTNPVASPSWKQARAVLSTAAVDGVPMAPIKRFQIAFEGVWGDAQSGAIAIDDITIFDGACEILPIEAKAVAGECTFDTNMCMWTNETMPTSGDMTDSARNPFFEAAGSVNSQLGGAPLDAINGEIGYDKNKDTSWRMASIDHRPLNLQDHTYRAPIGYVFIDVLDPGTGRVHTALLQSAEMNVAEGPQAPAPVCLAFWFVAFGRTDLNRLDIYVTQSSQQSQPSAPAVSSGSGSSASGGVGSTTSSPSSDGSSSSSSNARNDSSGGFNPRANSGVDSNDNVDESGEIPWRQAKGTLSWSLAMRNITADNRRRWLYGQVTLRVYSNYIVRFEGHASDGGFALDDFAFYEGACETRPANARVRSDDDESIDRQPPTKAPTP